MFVNCHRRGIVVPLAFVVAAAAISGCTDQTVATRAVIAPESVMVGEAIGWSVALRAGEEQRATVYDEQDRVVFHQEYIALADVSWTPFEPGLYLIRVEVRGSLGGIARGEALVDVMPRGGPMVTDTAHPLVALYTYTIPEGNQGSVSYTCESCPVEVVARTFTTPLVDGTGLETGALLPGLRPSSTYSVQHTIFDGAAVVEKGPVLAHTSGALEVELAAVTVLSPPVNPGTNALLAINPNGGVSMMVDEQATPVWYLPVGSIYRSTGNGWSVSSGPFAVGLADYSGQWTRVAPVGAVNRQLVEMGLPPTINFHHEVRPLPGNRIATLGLYERLLTDVQGPGTVDVLADTVIVLDDRMQVVWFWDAFDHLDVSRTALLDDVVEDGFLGIDLQLADEANDWTHMNSIEHDPSDGNLLLSVRHQDWVVKIAYEDGAGDGQVIWRLGQDGDFTIVSADPDPWFGYQHDANLLTDGRLAVFDNGNTRVAANGGGNSRGQVYILDEVNRIATLDINVDLGVFAAFVGSAAQAPDGNYHFNAGPHGLHDTVAADGTLQSSFMTDAIVYRSFRMRDPFDTSPN